MASANNRKDEEATSRNRSLVIDSSSSSDDSDGHALPTDAQVHSDSTSRAPERSNPARAVHFSPNTRFTTERVHERRPNYVVDDQVPGPSQPVSVTIPPRPSPSGLAKSPTTREQLTNLAERLPFLPKLARTPTPTGDIELADILPADNQSSDDDASYATARDERSQTPVIRDLEMRIRRSYSREGSEEKAAEKNRMRNFVLESLFWYTCVTLIIAAVACTFVMVLRYWGIFRTSGIVKKDNDEDNNNNNDDNNNN